MGPFAIKKAFTNNAYSIIEPITIDVLHQLMTNI